MKTKIVFLQMIHSFICSVSKCICIEGLPLHLGAAVVPGGRVQKEVPTWGRGVGVSNANGAGVGGWTASEMGCL